MQMKLKSVLLIDDDEATNFFNEVVLEESGYVEEIIIKQSGFDALRYLTNKIEGNYPQPELIFLDINMPGMDGWEFIEAYKNLPTNQRANAIIIMLTTSLNPDDQEKAESYQVISTFMHKPLSKAHLDEILENHFHSKLS